MATKTEIICHSPRELDALVAEYLMGWNWVVSGIPSEMYRGRFLATPDCFASYQKYQDGTPAYLPAKGDEKMAVRWWDAVPKYTTWAGVEAVIQNREAAGYWVSIDGVSGVGMVPGLPDAAFHRIGETQEAGYATGPNIPAAVCLAALASVGFRVKLELGMG